ncbi:PepSY-associated TM helix domain-containing protein [Pseudoalteromonas peptidolytica]|uniref:PepSY-associated TM helix domain-containing protein n=1 Tax=Pseudoalteromonas peptidolytica TaxID=61150 RepID=UPI00298E5BA9|nr:PepSY-associated TM helix domain-containing protein [Pseudoalteromonas peptidolytica]MDW7551427.1 PepSY-associated TM helix domain-containing protein [Pseudoalteromonas peptidolytica]
MKVRADILRIYQAVHTWTGITTGLLLFIGFFAGAITMFASSIDKWATPPSHQLPQVESTQYDTLIHSVLAQYPESQNGLKVSFEEGQSPITWYQQGSARGLSLDKQLWHGTLDESGELQAHTSYINELSALVDYLHRSAGIAGEIGHDQAGVYVLGIAAILYFIALISGVIFLLPTLVKSFFALRDNKGASRFWLDTHNLIGITSLPFHIIIALTVIVFAFHDILYGGLSKLYGDKPLFARDAPSKVEFNVAHLPSIEEIVARAKVYAPEHSIKEITLSRLNSKSPSASVQLVSDEYLMRGPKTDFLFMNPYTFEISTSSVINGDQGIWGAVVTTLFGLHFGSYGGEIGRWVYFFLGVLGAVLFYTGNLLWLEKRRKQKQAEQSKSTQIMGKLTIGVAMGAMLGVAAAFAVTKWVALTALNINVVYMWAYYLCFFITLMSAFIFGISKTAIWSQRSIAILCFSLPLSSIIAMMLPSLGIWPASGWSSVVLELSAAILGVIFWKMADKTRLRALYGEPNSIWFIGQSQDEQTLQSQSA